MFSVVVWIVCSWRPVATETVDCLTPADRLQRSTCRQRHHVGRHLSATVGDKVDVINQVCRCQTWQRSLLRLLANQVRYTLPPVLLSTAACRGLYSFHNTSFTDVKDIKSNQIKFICDKKRTECNTKKTRQICRQDTKAAWNCTNECPTK